LERVKTSFPDHVTDWHYRYTRTRPDAAASLLRISHRKVLSRRRYRYDLRGNLVRAEGERLVLHRSQRGRAYRRVFRTRFAYDAAGRLVAVTPRRGYRQRLAYGAGDELVSRESAPTNKPPSARRVIFYIGSDATITAGLRSGQFRPLRGGTEISVVGQQIATLRERDVLYYHRDLLGSVTATSLNGGRAGTLYHYTPYGVRRTLRRYRGRTSSGSGYTSALTLPSGLVLLGARAYAPGVRRFLQPDDIDIHRYTYAAGDPVNKSDPTG